MTIDLVENRSINTCNACELEKEECFQVRADQGPWSVDVWEHDGKKFVVLQSNDFHHDVALKISGDFGAIEKEIQYANLLCEQLNSSIMRDWARASSAQLRLFD
jgi:hypothetical protein